MKPLISICTSSNRPFLWKQLYDGLSQEATTVDFELLLIGPEDADFTLPSNIRHIKTADIKVPQCNEIGMRSAQGNLMLFMADDCRFQGGGLDELYRLWNKWCEHHGDNRVVMLPGFKDGHCRIHLRYRRLAVYEESPWCSLNCALFDKELLFQMKAPGIDIRFLGCYWDCDLAMRMHEVGIRFEHDPKLWCHEFKHEKIIDRLHRKAKAHDTGIFNSFWIKLKKEDEVFNTDEIYGVCKSPQFALVKARQDEVISYVDEDILIKSQGTIDGCNPKYGELHWV